MKKLLKIPAVILFGLAFYTWVTYDGYINSSETLFPWLNFQGVFGQIFNWFIVCVLGGLGLGLWKLSEDNGESAEDNK
jgi:hypothetical protein